MQFSPQFYSRQATVDKMCEQLLDLGRDGVQFAVFPETVAPYYPYFSFVPPPFSMGREHLQLLEESVTIPRAVTGQLADACREAGIIACIAVNARDGGTLSPVVAEAGPLQAAKDISKAGLLGTLLMLLEPTGCGAQLDLARIPRPADAPLERWLRAFPSYDFLLTLADRDLAAITQALAREGLDCAAIGRIDASARLDVQLEQQHAEFWNLQDRPFTGFSQAEES